VSDLFKNKYRIKSSRLQNWDYRSTGYYYITICVKNRSCVFGCVENDKMVLSDIGKIAEKYWREIPVHFPFVKLDEFIIMPNHVHGIIGIVETLQCNVSTNKMQMNNTQNKIMSNISPKYGSLSVIIRSYKSICSKIIYTNYSNIYFVWQSRFYDHIIRDDEDLMRIQKYIINNPLKWNEDDYHIE
jgi:putative transposase